MWMSIERRVRNLSPANRRGFLSAPGIFKKLATTPFYWRVAEIRRHDEDRAFMIAIVRRDASSRNRNSRRRGEFSRIIGEGWFRERNETSLGGDYTITRLARAIIITCRGCTIIVPLLSPQSASRAKVSPIVCPCRSAPNLRRTKTSLCKGCNVNESSSPNLVPAEPLADRSANLPP